MELWKSFPKEGAVYQVEHFKVESNNDQFKLAAHRFKLRLHESTVFRETNKLIAARGYHFIPIRSIVQETCNNIELIDVIGLLRNFGYSSSNVNENENDQRLNFTLADVDQSTIEVVLFGKTADSSLKTKVEKLNPPIIVLVKFSKIRHRSGFVQLTNSNNATEIILNPDIPEAAALLKGLEANPTINEVFSQVSQSQASFIPPSALISFKQRLSIQQVLQMSQPDDLVTRVTVKFLETSEDWKYEGCRCNAKLVLIEKGRYQCKKCPGEITSSELKFKVHYRVSDGTADCSIVFFNDMGYKLFGITASDLQQKLEKDNMVGSFPKVLSEIVGTEMLVLLKPKPFKKNFTQSSFPVGQFTIDKDLISRFTYNISSLETTKSEIQLEEDDTETNLNSPIQNEGSEVELKIGDEKEASLHNEGQGKDNLSDNDHNEITQTISVNESNLKNSARLKKRRISGKT